ncbi:MAG TPA: N-acetylmuramoyl-L-alanine amidase [Alphaproteobacteria bacterium]|nr:N-acetylmuramoyl-L-alanine amidase [Alphaproteobacteria bacterium]
MNFIDFPSPNHDARAEGATIDMLVLHYTGMPTGADALARLVDPAARVSAHYLIEEDGRVFRLVPEMRRAWHAGIAYWRGVRDINGSSIGVELVNPGHEFGYQDFPEAQMQALENLAKQIILRHAIPAINVVGHSDVAPQRKRDPGERFDWRRLARAGVGAWPTDDSRPIAETRTIAFGARNRIVGETQECLASYGYETPQSGELDAATAKVIEAFQRHFRPRIVDGRIDGETRSLAGRLAGAVLTARIGDRT